MSFVPATVGPLFAALSLYASGNIWTLSPPPPPEIRAAVWVQRHGDEMTAFSDFKAAISEWENRADWSDVLVTSFVRMAEAKFNAELRIDRMLSANDALIASRCAPLPDDWLETGPGGRIAARSRRPTIHRGFAPIVYKPRAEFFATQDEKAVGLYTIEGRQIFVGGLPEY